MSPLEISMVAEMNRLYRVIHEPLVPIFYSYIDAVSYANTEGKHDEIISVISKQMRFDDNEPDGISKIDKETRTFYYIKAQNSKKVLEKIILCRPKTRKRRVL